MSRTVWFATNRNPNDVRNPTDFGPNFSNAGLNDLRYGKAQVGSKDVVLQVAEESDEGVRLGSKDIMFEIKSLMENEKRDTLIYIHGFNTDFQEALRIGARLDKNMADRGRPMQVLVFTWPSDGGAFPWKDYIDDRHDAKVSGFAFARGLMKLRDFLKDPANGKPCGQNVHLMAHSMGNYVTRWTVQELRKMSGGRLPLLFDTVFHMAADEDDDAYEKEHKLEPLLDMCRSVQIYFNKHDKALIGSHLTKGQPDRLGSHGVRRPMDLPHKITQVDVGGVERDLIIDPDLNHTYLVYNDVVADDLVRVLNGENPNEMPGRTWDDRKNKFRLFKPKT